MKTNLKLLMLSLCMATTMSVAQASHELELKPQVAPSGVQYLAGGIGDAEYHAINEQKPNYNLRLTFAMVKTGQHLAGVTVKMTDVIQQKTLLDVVVPGPMLLANVPAGQYDLMVSYGGKTQNVKLNLKKGQAKGQVFYFADQ